MDSKIESTWSYFTQWQLRLGACKLLRKVTAGGDQQDRSELQLELELCQDLVNLILKIFKLNLTRHHRKLCLALSGPILFNYKI